MRYFISFVEEAIFNKKYKDCRAGRIEIYDSETDSQYADEEIRFFTDNVEDFIEFRNKYDFEKVDEATLGEIKREVDLHHKIEL